MSRVQKNCLQDEGREIYVSFRAASRFWFRGLHNPVSPAHALSLSEMRVLLDLLRQAPETVCVSELASEIDRSAAWTGRITSTLAQMGYVCSARSEKDRRERSISLTERGTELATALREHFSGSIDAALRFEHWS
jgi:DNA-binding MarR family transcriptional regulator